MYIGLQASELWPPEAFLLNLKLLHERCIVGCQQDQERQSGPGLGPGPGLGLGPELGSELHQPQHQRSSPTLYDLTHRYLSTRTSNIKIPGSSSSISSRRDVGARANACSNTGVSSSSTSLQTAPGATNRSGGISSTNNPPPQTFLKSNLGSSSTMRDSTWPPPVHEDDDDDSDDNDFYDCR